MSPPLRSRPFTWEDLPYLQRLTAQSWLLLAEVERSADLERISARVTDDFAVLVHPPVQDGEPLRVLARLLSRTAEDLARWVLPNTAERAADFYWWRELHEEFGGSSFHSFALALVNLSFYVEILAHESRGTLTDIWLLSQEAPCDGPFHRLYFERLLEAAGRGLATERRARPNVFTREEA